MDNPILTAAAPATVNYDNVQKVDFAAMRSEVEAQIANVLQSAGEYKNAAATALGITNAATDSEVSALGTKGSANAVVARAKANADLKAQRDTLAAANAMGGQARQRSLLRDLKDQGDEETRLLAERKARFAQEHTGLSIIDLVINAVQDIKPSVALESVKMQEHQTAQQLDYMANAVSQAAQISNLTKQTLTDAAIEANLNFMAADTQIQIAEARKAGAAANTQGMTQLMQASTDVLGAVRGKYTAQIEVRDQEVKMATFLAESDLRQVQLESSKLQLAENRATSEFRTTATQLTAVKQIEEDRAFQSMIADHTTAMHTGEAALGLPITSPETARKVLTGGAGKVAQEIAVLKVNIGAVPGAPIGKDFGDAVLTYRKLFPTGAIPETPKTELMHKIIHDEAEEHANVKDERGRPAIPKARNEAAYAEDLNAKADRVMSVYASDITKGNPFEAAPMQALAPILATKHIPFYDKVVAKIPSQDMDPTTLFQLAKHATVEGNVTAEEATQGLADMFKVAVEYNNTFQGGFARVGLPRQSSYMVTVHRYPLRMESFFGMYRDARAATKAQVARGKPLKVDMVDEVSIANALTKIHMDDAPAPPTNTSNEGTKNVK